MNRLSALRVEEPGFELVSSGRAYRCREGGCENRVLGLGDRCIECCDEDLALTVVRHPDAARREQESWEKWDRRLKTALEIWLTFWGWLKTSELVNWLLLAFTAWAVAYVVTTYSDMFVDWFLGR